MHKERYQTAHCMMRFYKALEIHIKNSICIEKKKIIGELIPDFEKSPTIAQRRLFKII